jgi:hypothetical protein
MISMNLLLTRRPTHILVSDASCPSGLGGYSVTNGMAWRHEIDPLTTHSRHMTKSELEQAGVSIHIQESGEKDKTIINHLDCNTAHRTLELQKTHIGNQETNSLNNSMKKAMTSHWQLRRRQ